jgi:hypothetical protein
MAILASGISPMRGKRSYAEGLSHIRIFGQHMGQFCQANGIGQLEKKLVLPATLSDSTIR